MDQRAYPRVPFSENVLLNGSILVKGIDLSEGGLFVHGRDITPGSVLIASFKLDSREFVLKVKVSNAQKSVGIGLTFIDLDDDQKGAIRSYVEQYSREQLASRKRKVLLVEDNDTNRRMNKSRLVCDGYFVTEACDGIEAISRLDKSLPDLVVLDLYMERMNGFKVLSYMKGNTVMKHIPVIVLSARGLQEEIERVMSLGAEGFLVKMVTSPAKLSEYIAKFF
jgi:CheY-like chemotaxis protein